MCSDAIYVYVRTYVRTQGKTNSTPKAESSDNLTDSNKEIVKPERPSSLQVNCIYILKSHFSSIILYVLIFMSNSTSCPSYICTIHAYSLSSSFLHFARSDL